MLCGTEADKSDGPLRMIGMVAFEIEAVFLTGLHGGRRWHCQIGISRSSLQIHFGL